jgi:hypothetical protein
MKNNNLADKVEKYSYMRPLTTEEMDEMRVELAEKAIDLNALEVELKGIKDEYKERMKPSSKRFGLILTLLEQKAEPMNKECYFTFDQKIGMAIICDEEGVEVGRRPLMADERQTSIFTELRTGTNE